MKNNSKQRNSIAGALFGVAVGDALGGPVEFMSPEDIIRRHVCVSDMIGGGWLGLAPRRDHRRHADDPVRGGGHRGEPHRPH